MKKQLAGERDIDPQRLRDAVIDDLLRDKLLGWLEENSTVAEKAPESDEAKAEKRPAAKKTTKAKPAAKLKATKIKASARKGASTKVKPAVKAKSRAMRNKPAAS